MELVFFFKGVAAGLAIAAPVGPVGVLCLQRALYGGRLLGLLSGLGAALADAGYACLAGLGVGFLSALISGNEVWLRFLGGLALVWLGVRTFRSKAASHGAPSAANLAGAFASTFLFTLTNPLTVLAFAAVFAGLGIHPQAGKSLAGLWLGCGVFLGSSLWWLALSLAGGRFRGRLAERMGHINHLAGAIIAGCGALALGSLF